MSAEKKSLIEIAEIAAGRAQEWADSAASVDRRSDSEVFMCASHAYDYMRVANYCNNALRVGKYPLSYVLDNAQRMLESAQEAEDTEATRFDEGYDVLTSEMAVRWAQEAQAAVGKLRSFLQPRKAA